MTHEEDALRRVQDGLLHLRRGLAPVVTARMQARFGADWPSRASRAGGGRADAALDAYGLLRTMIDCWREAFAETLPREERHLARSFVTMALEARNAVAHAAADTLPQATTLRYLDAMLQLLRHVQAPATEVEALQRLYDAQLRPDDAGQQGARPASGIGGAKPTGTIEARLLAYVSRNRGLDDDELSRNLDIRPRQAINQAARRLVAQGRLRRARGPAGKIVNFAEEPCP